MGLDFIDEHLLRIIANLQTFFKANFINLTGLAKALGASFVLVVIAGEAYQVMLQKKTFDFLAIARPVFIGIIISSWTFVCDGLSYPTNQLESASKAVFQREQMKVVALRNVRIEKAEQIKEKTNEAAAAAENTKAQITDGNMWDKMVAMGKDFLKNIQDQLATFGTLWQAKINRLLEEWVVKIGQIIWQIMVFFLFFIKEVFIGILKITGPITFALSILPAYKDAWSQWIARYISVSLYGFIGFFVLAAAMQLIKYGIEMDIKVLTTALTTSDAFSAYSKSSVVTAIFHVVGLMVGGLALRLVPELASWIIPTSTVMGAGSFASGATSRVTGTAKSAVNLATGGK